MPDSPFTAIIQFATPAPDVNPTTFAEAVEELESLAEIAIEGDATTYIVSTAEPGVDDRDKLWVKLTGSDNHLVGLFYFWEGYWRKVNTPRPYSIHLFSGDPSVYFDAGGKGIRGMEYDGYCISDGRNGTIDLSDKFIIGAHMNNTGATGYDPSSGWRTNVTGALEVEGGAVDYEHTLTDENLPLISLDGSTIQSDAAKADRHIIIDEDYNSAGNKQTTVDLAGQEEPEPIAQAIVPPFYALAYVAWVGYEAY